MDDFENVDVVEVSETDFQPETVEAVDGEAAGIEAAEDAAESSDIIVDELPEDEDVSISGGSSSGHGASRSFTWDGTRSGDSSEAELFDAQLLIDAIAEIGQEPPRLFMDTPITDYTVTEGFLLLIFTLTLFSSLLRGLHR